LTPVNYGKHVLKEVLVHTSDEEEGDDSEQEGGEDDSGEEEEEERFLPSDLSHTSTPRLTVGWRNVRRKKILNS
jgi:hypothetical protein